MQRIKAKFKAEFKVWLQDKDGIVELAESTQFLLLPSIHEDYLAVGVFSALQKHYYTNTVSYYELVSAKRINR